MGYHTSDHIHIEDPSWSKMLRHARLRCESKRAQSEEPIETGNRKKRRLDPSGGEKAGGERAAITHWLCWLER